MEEYKDMVACYYDAWSRWDKKCGLTVREMDFAVFPVWLDVNRKTLGLVGANQPPWSLKVMVMNTDAIK